MKKYLFIIAAFAMAILPACENDVDADLENMEGVLCLNAYLVAGADTNYVHVSRTSREYPAPVRDAVVKLYVNDNLVETVTDCYSVTYTALFEHEVYDDEFGWMVVEEEETHTDTVKGTYLLKSKFDVGDKVRVEVSSGNQSVWAEDVAPRKIENPQVSYTYEPGAGILNRGSDRERAEIEVSFDDVSADDDFYRMVIYSDFYKVVTRIVWFDPEEYDLHSKTEIIEYAKKNLDHPVFVDVTSDSVDVYYISKRVSHYWKEYDDYSYRRCPILSEGESQSSKDDDDDSSIDLLSSDVKNTYRVFSDKLFSNSTALLNVVTDWRPSIEGDSFSSHEDFPELKDYVGTFYSWRAELKLQSISEQQYYYLRAMNAINSSAYDEMSSFSGALKVPSNVHGGSGNFGVSTQTTVDMLLLDNYHVVFDGIYY
ncbi:MAG: DUF4249 family protein [Salinivirgaceae bacterium]|nr:DUF4249 family protein [Salinivirgaceae bacterium]